ncbi:GFA family protein [Yoonia sp. I 8.24]|uniref:GFA family protein n=1 Tax=Yoonia sp. I 8.24 TaxID=1537229 RepID=UPI001EDE2CD3|nr:GFA family protein [Yoonia sp. I 8.24]MCG3267205.1 GFA family protein [Yoonia sp. I 8.24]
MASNTETYDAACHCGTVQFQVTLKGGLASARRCTCSFCSMRGAVALTAPLDGLRFIAGQEALTLYQFNTHAARHYFCAKCGIYTHHKRRSNPNEFGINAACLLGVSPFDFSEVIVNNGVQHPSDNPDAPDIAGVLRYEKS